MSAGAVTQGRRLPDISLDQEHDWRESKPGDYAKVHRGEDKTPWWFVRDPYGNVGTLTTHTVVEHDDGTITVTPSILDPSTYSADDLRAMGVVSIISEDRVNGWHGYLERGVWREA